MMENSQQTTPNYSPPNEPPRKSPQRSLSSLQVPQHDKEECKETTTLCPTPSMVLKPIAHFRSCFVKKNGTPRQGSLCPQSRGIIELIAENCFGLKSSHHSLSGLKQFSHLWIIYYFHDNGDKYKQLKTCVKAPRLNGEKVGLFASRSPHRPNPIGLTLAKLDGVDEKKGLISVSSIDLIHETPIIDIKPYIPIYDCPMSIPFTISDAQQKYQSNNHQSNNHQDDDDDDDATKEIEESLKSSEIPSSSQQVKKNVEIRIPKWITEETAVRDVQFCENALTELSKIVKGGKLKFYSDTEDVRNSIIQVLRTDPRSVYRKTKCADKLYWFHLDELNIAVTFEKIPDKQNNVIARVLSIDLSNEPVGQQQDLDEKVNMKLSGDKLS